MYLLLSALTAALSTAVFLLLRTRRRAPVLAGGEAYLAQLFETFPHALVLRDIDGHLLCVNAEFTRLFQYSAPEVMGVNLDQLLCLPGDEQAREPEQKPASLNQVWAQTRRRRRDGTPVEVSHAGALLTRAGRPVACYEVFHDLTPQRTAEATITAQQRLLEAFFTQSLDGFFFMMLDEPIRWANDADKEALLDYAFAHHRVTRVNDAMLTQYGYTLEQMLGRTPADLYAHDLAEGRVAWRRFFDAGRLGTVTRERRADGTPMLVEGDYVCLYDDRGMLTGHFGIQRDITERTRQEEALRESEEKFAKAFRSSPFPITIATLREGRFLEVNAAFLRDVGFRREEVLGRTAHDLGLWCEPEARAELVRRLERDGMVREFEFVARTRNRDRQINHIWAERIMLQGQECLLDIVWDVTGWRANEEALRRSRQQLRDLAVRQQTVRETERTRIARELHDELGQALTGLKIDLAWVRGRLTRPQADLADRLQALMTRVDGTVEAVRRIATELRPGVLDLLGLVAAIEWQTQEFGRRTGIETSLDLDSDQSPVDDVRATTVFRILQEALTNVARHAGATQVQIGFTQTREHLLLEVADNGRGITQAELAGRRSLGLAGIRERAMGCGGALEIEGRPGEGTVLLVRIPCGIAGDEVPA
jgi:PAS domain S-box-containing protein